MLNIFLVVLFVAAVVIDNSNAMLTRWGNQVRKSYSQDYRGTGSDAITSKAILQPSYSHIRSKSSPAFLEDKANYGLKPNAPSIASTSRAPPTQPACPVLFQAVRQFFSTIQIITKWEYNLHDKFIECLQQSGIVAQNESFINYCAPKVYDESDIREELNGLKASIDPGVKEDICNAVKTYCLQTYEYRNRRPLGGAVQNLLSGCPEVKQTTFTIPRVAPNADNSNASSPEPMRVGPNQVEIRNKEEYVNFMKFVENYDSKRSTKRSRGSSNIIGGCVPRSCQIL